MSGKELYNLGMTEYDKGNFKEAVPHLENALKKGFQRAGGILCTLYTSNDFGLKLNPEKFKEKMQSYVKESGNVFAKIYLGIDYITEGGSQAENLGIDLVKSAVEEAEIASKASEDENFLDFNLLGPVYAQIGATFMDLSQRRPEAKDVARKCFDQGIKYADQHGIEQLRNILTMMKQMSG